MSGFFKRLVGKKTEEAYSGWAADHLGWVWNDSSSTFLNVTPRFEEFIGHLSDESFELPPDAHKYTYMLVPGLFTNKYPGYMSSPEEALKKRGLNVIKIKIDTGGSVETNATIIKFELEHAPDDRKVVLIGHSKGAVDVAAALSMYPHLLPFVRCFVAVQAPFGGTPIPQDVMGASGFLNAVVETLRIFDPDAMKDITYAHRREFLQLHPYPADLVPTLSFGSFTIHAAPLCSSTQKHIQEKYGALSDGLVPLKDAFIPGSAIVILEGADHGSPVFSFGTHDVHTPGRIFLALIATALEMPPNVSKLCRHPLNPLITETTGDSPQQGEVFLYEHSNYLGEVLKLKGDCENLADHCMNNKISSIKVGPNTVLEAFDNVYFAGIPYRLEGENPVLEKALNDIISSCRIVVPSLQPPPSAQQIAPFNWNSANATLDVAHAVHLPGPVHGEIWGYPHPHYQGPPLGYKSEIQLIPELIASIRLGPYMAATVFPEPNFAGLPYEITGDHPTLPLRIVSAKVHEHHSLHGVATAVATTLSRSSSSIPSPNMPAAATTLPPGAYYTSPPWNTQPPLSYPSYPAQAQYTPPQSGRP